MTAEIVRINADVRSIKVSKPDLLARLVRQEQLIQMAVETLLSIDDTNVEWPNELVRWYRDNFRKKVLTFDQAYDMLSPEQRQALFEDDGL